MGFIFAKVRCTAAVKQIRPTPIFSSPLYGQSKASLLETLGSTSSLICVASV